MRRGRRAGGSIGLDMSDEQPAPGPASAGSTEASPPPDRPSARAGQQAVSSGGAAVRAPMHASDRVPRIMLRGQAWLQGWFSNESRLLMGVVVVTVAVVAAIAVSSLRFVQVAFGSLDIFVVLTLFLVNWLGNGGVLVPIPGARFIGLLMVFQQAVMLPSWEVLLVAGAAMGLGQLSYYVAGARTAQSYADGDDASAQQIAGDTGMLDDKAADFAPGAKLDAEIVSAIADVDTTPAVAAGTDGSGRQRGASDAAGSALGPPPSRGWRSRFSNSLKQAQDRARPVLEQRGAWGMFLLCFAPTPLGTAAAYVGGLIGFGFKRYLISSFASKFLLTGVVVVLALVFSDAARAVALPEIELPKFELPEFDLRLFELPDFWPAKSAVPSPAATPTTVPSD